MGDRDRQMSRTKGREGRKGGGGRTKEEEKEGWKGGLSVQKKRNVTKKQLILFVWLKTEWERDDGKWNAKKRKKKVLHAHLAQLTHIP